jgi:hypothetical protein
LITAVRGAMGDDAFFSAMRSWTERHRHGFIRARALLRHLLEAADVDLVPIYRRYLDGPAVALPFRLIARAGPPSGPSLD